MIYFLAFHDHKHKAVNYFVDIIFIPGPLASITIKLIGFRGTLCTGAVLVAIGLVSSAFVPSIEWLYLTYGIVAGKYIFNLLDVSPNINIDK